MEAEKRPMASLTLRQKLIEVALPLDSINEACGREKSIRHGHPSTLHLWWARRPLSAARAVIFAQMVDDPSAHPESFPTLEEQDRERERLFAIIRDIVQWENSCNKDVLERARAEIIKSWRGTCQDNDATDHLTLFDPEKLPGFHDPFAGGGTIPLEAQRLGLNACASDLNPVSVLINKAMIEVPQKFIGFPAVNPDARRRAGLIEQWHGSQGLANDVRFYGRVIRDEARRHIGHFYPDIEITPSVAMDRPDLTKMVGRKLPVVAWLWARTVKSPNPALKDVDVPLVSTFVLSTKKGGEAYIDPRITEKSYQFVVKVGEPPEGLAAGTKLGRGANFRCLLSGTAIEDKYIKSEGENGRLGSRLLAIVAKGDRGRVYLSPTPEMERIAREAIPTWTPDLEISGSTQYLGVKPYGMHTFGDIFTDRQLLALQTFSSLIRDVRGSVIDSATSAGLEPNGIPIEDGGEGAEAYADAVQLYLAFALTKLADRGSTICTWYTERDSTTHTFSRQSIPMTWDFAELNTLLDGTGSFVGAIDWTAESIEGITCEGEATSGRAVQADARKQQLSNSRVVSTDPPYYDNVPYADLSDFFYIWLRDALKMSFPTMFPTIAVPKDGELVAFAHRHGSKNQARQFFVDGMKQALHQIAQQAHPAFPTTIFYAFKQAEDANGDRSSTGWETFLEALLQAGLSISGTWPMRTELANRKRSMNANALASSIVLVCRPRIDDAPVATRREFIASLKGELPVALAHLQHGNIAPVDLAQSAIGPGMAVFTRYAKVVDADGKALSVREALALINEVLDEVLAQQEGDFDAESRFAIAWFDQTGFDDGEFGIADVLARAKNTAVATLVESGIAQARGGKLRLLKPEELSTSWDPHDSKSSIWITTHHLARALNGGGESAAASLVKSLGNKADVARELAYRLYTIADKKKRPSDALSYNALVQSWPEIVRLSRNGDLKADPVHVEMFTSSSVHR